MECAAQGGQIACELELVQRVFRWVDLGVVGEGTVDYIAPLLLAAFILVVLRKTPATCVCDCVVCATLCNATHMSEPNIRPPAVQAWCEQHLICCSHHQHLAAAAHTVAHPPAQALEARG